MVLAAEASTTHICLEDKHCSDFYSFILLLTFTFTATAGKDQEYQMNDSTIYCHNNGMLQMTPAQWHSTMSIYCRKSQVLWSLQVGWVLADLGWVWFVSTLQIGSGSALCNSLKYANLMSMRRIWRDEPSLTKHISSLCSFHIFYHSIGQSKSLWPTSVGQTNT